MEYGDMTIQDTATVLPGQVVGTVNYALDSTASFSVTGVGFTPSSVILMTAIAGSDGAWSMELASGPGGISGNQRGIASYHEETADSVYPVYQTTMVTGVGNEGWAILTSFDSDGFTMARQTNPTPSGTATMAYMAFK